MKINSSTNNEIIDCDVLIIGSGAGGASVADVLSQTSYSIVMLEEGPYVDFENVPKNMTTSLKKMWRNSGLTVALGKTPVSYAEGRCVGGGTEINSAIFQKTPADLLSEWQTKYQIENFSAESLSPHYDYAAHVVNASLPTTISPSSQILKTGADRLHWKSTLLERGIRECVNTNMCASGCPTGGKQSMSATLIPKAIKNGLRLIANCRVDHLNIHNRRINTVTATIKESNLTRKITIKPKTVFLCAGAIYTPSLLLKSGIRHNVGQSLQLHPTLKCIAVFNDRIDAHLSQLPVYAITEFMPNQRMGGSVFTLGTFGMSLAEDWNNRNQLMTKFNYSAVYYIMIRGRGIGKISNLPWSSDPLVRYQLTSDDWINLTTGLGHLKEALFAAGAQFLMPSISHHKGWQLNDPLSHQNSNELEKKYTNLMTIHLFSSCPPGENSKICATDSFGRVFGIENLIVADGSQIPEAPGVNPQATIMAISRRNAKAWLESSELERKNSAFSECTLI